MVRYRSSRPHGGLLTNMSWIAISLVVFSSISITASSPVDPCREIRVTPSSLGDIAKSTGNVSGITSTSSSESTGHGKGKEIVLITGGSGFIGSHLVELLLENGYHVRVYDNLETGHILYIDLTDPRIEFIFGDILEAKKVQTALTDVTAVLHLAAASKVLPSLIDPSMATFNTKNNAMGTAILLEGLKKEIIRQEELYGPNKRPFKKIVYAGSSTYYGNHVPPYREDMLFNTTSPYAASKYMGELQLNTYDKVHDVPSVNLRFFMVYGPRQPSTGGYAVVNGVFTRLKMESKPLPIDGSGEQFRDFVHVRDVGRAIILAMQNPTLRETAINVGSGTTRSVNDVADLVEKVAEQLTGERNIDRINRPARKNDLLGTLADTCKAKKELKFETRYDFDEVMAVIIKKTMEKNGNFEYKHYWDSLFMHAKSILQGTSSGDIVPESKNGLDSVPDMGFSEKNAIIREAFRRDPFMHLTWKANGWTGTVDGVTVGLKEELRENHNDRQEL